MFLPKIYPITNVSLAEISHTKQVKQLVNAGAEFIQIREKNAPSNEFYQSAKEAMKIARDKSVKILINDRVDIAAYVKADGVHLGQDDLPPKSAREILGTNAIIGLSTHSIEQAIEALKQPINYIAIGPIFQTETKKNPDNVVGLEDLKEIRDAIGDFPLVAIGGITIDNFADILDAGADSVALISSLLSPPDRIEKNFESFTSKMPAT